MHDYGRLLKDGDLRVRKGNEKKDRNLYVLVLLFTAVVSVSWGGSVAEWLACWTQAQKGPGSNRSRDAVR